MRVKVCSWVRYVFLMTCWVMVLPPWVTCPLCFTRASPARKVAIQSTPVWLLKRLSSLSDVCVLNVHADAGDAHILVVAGIDKPDLPPVLVVNNGIGQF